MKKVKHFSYKEFFNATKNKLEVHKWAMGLYIKNRCEISLKFFINNDEICILNFKKTMVLNKVNTFNVSWPKYVGVKLIQVLSKNLTKSIYSKMIFPDNVALNWGLPGNFWVYLVIIRLKLTFLYLIELLERQTVEISCCTQRFKILENWVTQTT